MSETDDLRAEIERHRAEAFRWGQVAADHYAELVEVRAALARIQALCGPEEDEWDAAWRLEAIREALSPAPQQDRSATA